MHILVTSAQRLVDRYGPQGLLAIEQALDDLIAARASAGIFSRRFAFEDGLADLGVAGAAVSWPTLAAQLGAIAAALVQRGDRLESLLIIGGPDIVPFGVLPNPMFDSDREVLADCVYAVAAGVWPPDASVHGYGTDWPVGRLPDATEPVPTVLLAQIATAARWHRAGSLQLVPALGLSTAAWQVPSARVLAELDGQRTTGTPLLLSPPLTPDTLDKAQFAATRLLYCNLHGVQDAPNWYGQAAAGSSLLVAVRSSDLAGLHLPGALVVTEACYGARLGNQTPADSLALALLASQVAAFIGATAITYGPLQPPSGEADLLALYLLRSLCVPGTFVGAALLGARLAVLRDALLSQGFLDEDDEKTVLEFVLYGDPMLRV